MIEYELASGFSGDFGYSELNDTITMGTRYLKLSRLNDDELLEFISDCIVHEFMHGIVYKMAKKKYGKRMGSTLDGLFDTIAYLFVTRRDLDLRMVNVHCEDWHTHILKHGMEDMFDYYFMSQEFYMSNLDILLGHKKGRIKL